MKLYIRDSKNETKTIFIMESDSVDTLKNEIKNKFDITTNIELIFNGNILQENDQLSDLGITDEQTIEFQGQFTAGK
jgi:ribosomal protein S13